MNTKAQFLISKHSKSWLAEQLSLTRPTLDVRLKKGNWKKIEVEKILKLSK